MPRRVVAAAAAAVLMVLAVQFCDLAVVTRRSSSQNAERRTEPTRGSHNSAEQLQPPRHQWRQQQQPGQLQQQHQPQQDVLVAIASPLDWWMRGGSRDWREPNCTLDDAPLGCRFVHLATGPGAGPASFNDSACAVLAAADAHLWHRCPPTPTQRAAAACGRGSGRPTVLMSAESSVNYPCMNDAGAMAAGSVDIEMSYRRCAQVRVQGCACICGTLGSSCHQELQPLALPCRCGDPITAPGARAEKLRLRDCSRRLCRLSRSSMRCSTSTATARPRTGASSSCARSRPRWRMPTAALCCTVLGLATPTWRPPS